MATRYFVKGLRVYVSPTPAEHQGIKALGFVMFSPWDAIKYDAKYGSHYCPESFTLLDMAKLTELGKSGNLGLYQKGSCYGSIRYEGSRVVKVGRGQWELQAPEATS